MPYMQGKEPHVSCPYACNILQPSWEFTNSHQPIPTHPLVAQVGVDLWHVPMCRKDGTLHVLALREDSDTRAPREDHEPDREPQPLPQMIPRMSSENGPERLCGAVLELGECPDVVMCHASTRIH